MVQIQIDLRLENGVIKMSGTVLQNYDALTKEANLANDILKQIQESLPTAKSEVKNEGK